MYVNTYILMQDRLSTESGYQEIDCHINGDYSIGCRKEGDEVYVPFSFIHKYFEVCFVDYHIYIILDIFVL